MANVISKQLPLVLLAGLFSPAIAGLYMLANRVANAPVAIISDAANKVFLAEGASARKQLYLGELSANVLRLLLQISVGPFFLLAVIAPELFGFLFGQSWTEAGVYMQMLVPHMAAVFIFVPVLSLFAILERQKAGLVFQIVMLLSSVGALYLGWLLGDPKLAILFYAVGTAVVYVTFGFGLLKIAGVASSRLLKIVGRELILVGPPAMILLLIKNWQGEQSFAGWNLLLFISFALVFLGLSFLRARSAVQDLNSVGKAAPNRSEK